MNNKFISILIILCFQINLLAQGSEKKKLIEIFSGTWCGWCPNGDYMLDTLIQNRDDFIPVVVHWDDALSFDAGDELVGAFASGSPSATFDRLKFDFAYNVSFSPSGWERAVDHNYGSIVPFEIAVDNIYDPATRKITIGIEVKSNAALSGDFRVNCYVVQKAFSNPGDPHYFQSNFFNLVEGSPFEGRGDFITDYTFENVARAMLGGPWGSEGVITSPTVKNQVYSKQYEYTLEEEYDFENFKIIALVHQFKEDVAKRKVYNATDQDVKLKEEDPVEPVDTMSNPIDTNTTNVEDTMVVPNVGLQDLAFAKRIAVYPNPATDFINIQTNFENTNDVEVELLDVKGKMIADLNFTILSEKEIRAKIPADVLNGIYFIKMKGINENGMGKILVLR